MEGGGSDQDYDEFEVLLGEINVTSASPHAEESVPVNASPNPKELSFDEKNSNSSSPTTLTYYRTSQATSPDKSVTFYGGLSFERPKTVSGNSFQTPFDQKLQMNGTLEGGKMTMNNHSSPIKNAGRDDSKNSEDQLLAFAFTELNFEDGVAIGPRSPSLVNSKTSLNSTYLLEGQYPNYVKKPRSSLNSRNEIISSPSSPNTLNAMTLLSPRTHNLDKFNVEVNGEESFKLDIQELKNNNVSCKPLENMSGGLEEQQRSLPTYFGADPMAPSAHRFQVLSSVPVHGLEVTPYQQQHSLDVHSFSPYMQPQEISQSHFTWPYIEEERYYRMHQHYLHLQQLQNHGSGAQNLIQENINATVRPIARNMRQPYYVMPFSHQLEQADTDHFYDNTGSRRRFNPSEITVRGNGYRYYAQGISRSEESCPFVYDQKQTSVNPPDHSSFTLSGNYFEAAQVFDQVGKQAFPEMILTTSHGLNSLRSINPGSMGEHKSLPNDATTNGRLLGNGYVRQYPSILNAGSFQLRGSYVDGLNFRHSNSRLLPQKYNSVDEVAGRIYLMAKDQIGCRFLQRKFIEGNVEDVNKIFLEMIDHIVELMTDPFGNYLVQKLLEVCNEGQRMQILHALTRKQGDLVGISSDMHGTRSIQKVIETLKTPDQFSMVVSLLKPDILTLIKDMNGNHVAQRCLQCWIPKYSEFLFEAVLANFIELATHRHGCCVLQKCLTHSDGEQRHRLVYEITSNALILSQDPFGNYVVQHVFDLQVLWGMANVLNQLDGNYDYLSMQKYSSNVVEKCLQYAGEECRSRIIQELINSSRLDQISQHPFGNYVIQAALNHSKGIPHAALVEALEPHVLTLQTSPFGKKVLSCISMKK